MNNLKILGIGIFFTCCVNDLAAQNNKPLKIGEFIPETLWKDIPKQKATKLVILDFWATNCSTCIGAFPKMEKLQNQYDPALQVVMVNSLESGAEIKSKFDGLNKTRKPDKHIKLPANVPVINSASQLFELFPYQYIPQHVWLNSEGKVLAITEGSEATDNNIRNAIDGKEIHLEIKKDFFTNKMMDLGDDFQMERMQNLSLFIKGKIDVVGKAFAAVRYQAAPDGINRIHNGFAIRNLPLILIYENICNYLSPLINTTLINKHFLVDVKDSSKLYFNPGAITKELWEKDNLYTYDKVVPVGREKSLYFDMLNDLNVYTNYNASIKDTLLKCLALIVTDPAKLKAASKSLIEGNAITPDSIRCGNMDFDSFANVLDNYLENIKPIIINETGSAEKISIALPRTGIKDIGSLKRALEKYGISIKEVKRKVKVFSLTDKTVNSELNDKPAAKK
jgi:thiol-disulfide isomerase/thioredoxin